MKSLDIKTLLKDRDPDPIAFSDATPTLAWGDETFSRHFYELHTRGDGDTGQEVEKVVKWLGLEGGEHILDLGCGGGRTLEALAALGMTGAGIDIGPFPVSVARECLADFSMDVELGDMRTSLPQGPFDAVVCLFGQLTCFEEKEAQHILENARKSLKPGGQLFLEMYLGPQMLEAMDGMLDWMSTDRWLGGTFPQLVLDEHLVNWDRNTYIRRSYVLGLSAKAPPLQTFIQCSEIYDETRLEELLERSGFQLRRLYGDWDETPFDDESFNMIALATAI